ncbi:MAG TPA: sugar transferase [Terriglobales bacterium]|nr:sugar transferase [Terriglobales bacterium]
MATATIDTIPSKAQAAFPSRLIPGTRASAAAVSRKKAAPAAVDRTIWLRQSDCEPTSRQQKTTWQRFSEAVLPQPATPNQRAALAMAASADFFAIAVSYSICAAFSQQIRHAVPLLLLPGLLVPYGSIFTLFGYSERLYHPETIQCPQRERSLLAKVLAWSTVLVIGAQFFSQDSAASLVTPVASSPLSFILMLAFRRGTRRVTRRGASGAANVRNVVIVGAGKLGRNLASHLNRDSTHRLILRGFLDNTEPLGGDVRGRIRDLALIARRYFVDEIILTIPYASEAAREAVSLARRNRIDIKVVPDLLGFDAEEVTFEKVGNVPVLTLREERIPTVGLLMKRIIDVVFSAAALLLAAPFLAAIAIAIKLDSSGPVFYSAPRLGRKGRRFHCWKFRTMGMNANQLKEKLRLQNERQGAFFKITNDPRITRVGRILRRYSLDELPQLWNVLRGEMSLVGPRPHPVDDFERYQLEDWQRLEITPGLTGLWQVTARHDPSFERSMSLDREYIAGWNLWLDFKILCRTMLVVLRGEGA